MTDASVTSEFEVCEEHNGLRLDVFLAEVLEDASRSFVKKLIKDERTRINGKAYAKPGRTLSEGDIVAVDIPPAPSATPEPQDIPLDVLFEDASILIVNKPPGLVVHPAPGHREGTLVNAVLFRSPEVIEAGMDPVRPGIVHRLDRDTSGVMVVAKTPRAFAHLAKQASEHTFDRRYLALVRGAFKEDSGRIEASIGRSLKDRSKMAVTGIQAKHAVTHFEVRERYGPGSLVALQLETGRTHQIRVHLRFAGRPVLGDPVYGVTDFKNWEIPDNVRAALKALEGQALHAELLGIMHPETGERLSFTAPPPADFAAARDALKGIHTE